MYTVLWPILRRCLKHPKRIAVVDDQRTWRYIDLLGGATHLARAIAARSKRRNIGILLPTSGAFPMAMLAIWMLKRTGVPLNYLMAESERQYVVEHAELDLVISASAMIEFLGGPPKGVEVLEIDKMAFKGVPPLWRMLRLPTGADETVMMLYTSGTSGKPKGVMLTNRNLRSNVEAARRHAELKSIDTFLGVLPQFHSFGLTGLTLVPLMIGAKVVYTARFVPRQVVRLIKKHEPQIIMAIPSMYNALMTVKEATTKDFEPVRLALSGGEPLPQAVFEQFQERFGTRITEGYGLTETSPIVCLGTERHWRRYSVGRLIPDVSVRIVDDNDQEVTVGEEGEILIAGPNIMAGYFKQPELTDEAIYSSGPHEGYLRTGDWGKVDEDGFLYITGRKKEMLIIGGENVFPREIEEVLNRHPSVKDSAVVGRADPSRGEVPIAFVELNEGAAFNEGELRAFCREHLAGYKAPKTITCLEALPRNPIGKIMRRELPREAVETEASE